PSVQKRLQGLLDIFNLVVGCHPRPVAIGIQPKFLVSNPKADVIGLIHIWLDPQEGAEQRFRSSDILDRIDNGSDTLIHNELLFKRGLEFALSEAGHFESRADHDGKHFPNASNSLGEPLRRIFLRSKAQTRFRSLARKPSQVLASALT